MQQQQQRESSHYHMSLCRLADGEEYTEEERAELEAARMKAL
jgi:hypothetical protein